jgi:hypothetical protein
MKKETVWLIICGQAIIVTLCIQISGLTTFENKMLRRTFEPKGEEATRRWRHLHSKRLHNLYSSLNIIGTIELREKRKERHAARMGK